MGYSKEHRVDPQIIVGLLADRGKPLERWKPLKVTKPKPTPSSPSFNRHGLHDFVVVADAGMLSTGNLKALDEAGIFFIVGARQSQAPHDLEQYWDQHGDDMVDG